MRLIVTIISCFAICCTSGFSQNGGATQPSDQDFADLVAQTDMTEAHLGQLAADAASSQSVKDYAQMLVTDHTSDYNEITALATKAGLTVPKGLDAKHEKMIASFGTLKGAAFDRRYIREMIAGHEAAIAAYDKEARDGQNADLKNYAQQTVATLEKHKRGAQDLRKTSK